MQQIKDHSAVTAVLDCSFLTKHLASCLHFVSYVI